MSTLLLEIGTMASLVTPKAAAAPVRGASGGSITFTNASVDSFGQTPAFSEYGEWRMDWKFDCGSSQGKFSVLIGPRNNQAVERTFDNTSYPLEMGFSGSGFDYYYNLGSLALAIQSNNANGVACQWQITVSPDTSPPPGPNMTFSSSTMGADGHTQRFVEAGNWTMSWAFNCPPGGYGFDATPTSTWTNGQYPTVNSNDTSGSGSYTYTDLVGVISINIHTQCDWTIQVKGIAAQPGCNKKLPSGSVVGMAATADGKGYWIASSNGAVASCGDAPMFTYTDAPAGTTAIAAAPDGNGYWLVTGAGHVSAYGSALDQGSIASTVKLASPIVAMATDPATGGYWLLGGDGGVFSYNAPFYGSTGNIHLNKPAVGMAATPDGAGYYFVASDGGIFAFGKAPFYGSTGNVHLNKPVVGMAIDPATGGYWMDASDGGIFSFHAPFDGSTGNVTLAQPCVGMTAMPDGSGYRFVAADGGIFSFRAPFEGSAA